MAYGAFLPVLAIHIYFLSNVAQGARMRRAAVTASPVRKVINMLEKMQAKLGKEGDNEEKLYKKYMCYCKENMEALEKSIQEAEDNLPQLQSALEQAVAKEEQFKNELKAHEEDRTAGLAAVQRTAEVGERESANLKEDRARILANIKAIDQAVAALEKGKAGEFLQTDAGAVLERLVQNADLDEDAKTAVVAAFSSNGKGAATAPTNEIIGILKQMKEDMQPDVPSKTQITDALNLDLIDAKKKEIRVVQSSIEGDKAHIGEVGVQEVSLGEEVEDLSKAFEADKKFYKELKIDCAQKKKHFETNQAMRIEEVRAIGAVIDGLNNDQSLETFTKSFKTPTSLLQMQASRGDALRNAGKRLLSVNWRKNVKLDLIAFSMGSKKVKFDKVLKMIEDVVILLKEEQADDDSKQEFCNKKIDKAEDDLKELEKSLSELQTVIADKKGAVHTVADDITKLAHDIEELDRSVAEATEQRKEDYSEYISDKKDLSAAKEIIEMAMGKLNQFYKEQSLVQKSDSSDDAEPALVQLESQSQDAPRRKPEAWDDYEKKSSDSMNVLHVLDFLAADLTKQLSRGETWYKESQEAYEELMKDSKEKREAYAKLLAEKEAAKADITGSLQRRHEEDKARDKEIMAAKLYLMDLHKECDFLLMNFDQRKEARKAEMEALRNAKAVLSGSEVF